MSTNQNRVVVLKYAQSVWNERQYDVVDEVISEKYQHHSLGYGGPKAIKEDIAGIHRVFPDAEWEFHDTIAEGDKVTLRFSFRGTHEGSFLGIEPTGKRVDINAIAIYRLEDSKIIEEWAVLDFYTLMKQVGQV